MRSIKWVELTLRWSNQHLRNPDCRSFNFQSPMVNRAFFNLVNLTRSVLFLATDSAADTGILHCSRHFPRTRNPEIWLHDEPCRISQVSTLELSIVRWLRRKRQTENVSIRIRESPAVAIGWILAESSIWRRIVSRKIQESKRVKWLWMIH